MSAINLGDSAVVKDLLVNGKSKTIGTQTVDDLIVDGDLTCKKLTAVSGIQTFKTTQADTLFLTTGALDINGLATSNPGIGGRVWNDGGTLKIV
tara:strand:+ start:5322 stop:5603 length:282 start_codon:yes stop_codon:yes gene_type:complete